MFRDRADAADQLALKLKGKALDAPIVLAIPRGGVVIGAILAKRLNADWDVVLSRKLRAPDQTELAIGAIGEDGQVFLNERVIGQSKISADYLRAEQDHQLAEIIRRKSLFRDFWPRKSLLGRSVIVTDDGIATGSTMLAALQSIRLQAPREIILAIPVAAPRRLAPLKRWCDEIVCLSEPSNFFAVGQFYKDFTQLEDCDVVALLKEFADRQGSTPGQPMIG